MTYSDIEKKFGKGEKIEFPYEMEYFTYQFANSKKVFIFPYTSLETESVEPNAICIRLAVPLNEIITNYQNTSITKENLSKYFNIEGWDTLVDTKGTDSPWGGKYAVYGKYNQRHFNMYLEANDVNKISAPMDTYVYF
jgi:hypothetical protein